jgi:hypothetical protein
MSSNLSFSVGALFGGQHSDCGKADLSATVMVQCAALPTAATSVSGPATVSVSTPPSVSTSTSTSTSTTAQTSNATPTRITPTVTLNPGKGGALGGKFVVGAQTITFDADVLARLKMTAQTQSMNEVSADYAALSSVHATYTSASQAFQAKRSACMNQGYTPAQQIANCPATDSAVACAERLVAICDGNELKALNSSRLAVNSTAAKLAKDAQALSNATATMP